MATKKINPNSERKTTPKKYKVAQDVRKEEGAGKYPNYWSYKSRSGHNIIMDDSKDNESVTIQHRSGSAIQMRPDGSVHFTTHNGKYEVVFGEDRITVSGAQDITVKGDASLRVYGDYNVTCHKNYNLTVMGDYNFTAKNLNRQIRGNIDTQAKNETKKLEGSSGMIAHGAIARVAKGAATFVSHGDQVHVGGGKGANFHMPGEDGALTVYNNKGDTHIENKDGKMDGKFTQSGKEVSMVAQDGTLNMQSEENTNIKSKNKSIKVEAEKDIGVTSSSGGIEMTAQSGDYSLTSQKVKVDASSEMHMKSGGDAGFEGSTTHVGGSSGTTHVVGGSVNVEPLAGMLNLAGGGGMPFPGNINPAFEFEQIKSAVGLPDINTQMASQPTEEEDSSAWTNKLA